MGLAGLVAACGGGSGGRVDDVSGTPGQPRPGSIPTIVGGVDLGRLDPVTVLVGEGLAFGAPLPSEQAAAEAYTADPEVTAALVRRVYTVAEGRHLADAVVLVLDGSELFDTSVLAAFVEGAVSAAGGGRAGEAVLASRPVVRSADPEGKSAAVGFLEANLLTIVTAPSALEADLIVTRQLEARARGEVGSSTPLTPLVATPVGAAFVSVPTVTFASIPPAEDEPAPEAPGLAGATAVEGRYGVVAGERRTVVWAFSVDLAAYPSAEALVPAMEALATSRSGGTPVTTAEVGGRVVYSSSAAPGSPSAQVFRHLGLVLVVEGVQPDQLDAVTTAWIAALGPS